MAMASYSSGEMSRMAPVRISADTGRQNAAVGRMTPMQVVVEPGLADQVEHRHDHGLGGDREAEQEQPEDADVVRPRLRTMA